jgi:hypothetical protein
VLVDQEMSWHELFSNAAVVYVDTFRMTELNIPW